MREFLDRHYIIKALLALIIYLAINFSFKLICELVGVNFDSNTDYFIREILSKVLPAVGIMLLFKATYSTKQFSAKSFFKCFISGLVFLVISAGELIGLLIYMNTEGKSFKGIPDIIVYIIFVLAIGLSEELFFRGVLPDIIRGNEIGSEDVSKKRAILAAVVSSLLFGFVHIVNIFVGQGVYDTIGQMIYASCVGFIFYAVYNKHKNLYGLIVLHAIVDFAGLARGGLIKGASIAMQPEDSGAGAVLGASILGVVFLLVALFIYLPKRKILRKIFKREKHADGQACAQ